ncbi:MAG: TIGR04283 family arsenosugar biosynthesis glycosyltransferase [Nitrospiraceae bacterium]|nr:MAG: TIGR04283 family arsenosugar biosynthesis glycosyltransferase [Nitrospiraceae bacterium]
MKLSIIIPTLNESHYLPVSIQAVRDRSVWRPHEVIVADCGSSDDTPDIATQSGAIVVRDDADLSSRASAMNRGASSATGDVLLFLDADSLVPKGYDDLIRKALQQPVVVGGAFEFAFDGTGLLLRMVELVNRLRYRIWPRYFGDQGIFVRKEVFDQLHGYPAMRIMEASHFCVMLNRVGKLKLIRSQMKTSPRRFTEGGVCRVFAKDIWIWWLDLLGRQTERFADAYQKNNRARGKKV